MPLSVTRGRPARRCGRSGASTSPGRAASSGPPASSHARTRRGRRRAARAAGGGLVVGQPWVGERLEIENARGDVDGEGAKVGAAVAGARHAGENPSPASAIAEGVGKARRSGVRAAGTPRCRQARRPCARWRTRRSSSCRWSRPRPRTPWGCAAGVRRPRRPRRGRGRRRARVEGAQIVIETEQCGAPRGRCERRRLASSGRGPGVGQSQQRHGRLERPGRAPPRATGPAEIPTVRGPFGGRHRHRRSRQAASSRVAGGSEVTPCDSRVRAGPPACGGGRAARERRRASSGGDEGDAGQRRRPRPPAGVARGVLAQQTVGQEDGHDGVHGAEYATRLR